MAAKEFWLIVDVETTVDNKVFDFAAVVVDRKGVIHAQCAVIVHEFINHQLFYIPNEAGHWSKDWSIQKRKNYDMMLADGRRMVASVTAINRWLEKACGKYNPTLTAYNSAFDKEKCAGSGIDLTMFKNSFCLWHLACTIYAKSKAYRAFVLENHYFGNRTGYGNMTYKTNAEVMSHFIKGEFTEEPHTALEDIIGYELPIFQAIAAKKDWKKKIIVAYNWREFQLKNAFTACKPVQELPL